MEGAQRLLRVHGCEVRDIGRPGRVLYNRWVKARCKKKACGAFPDPYRVSTQHLDAIKFDAVEAADHKRRLVLEEQQATGLRQIFHDTGQLHAVGMIDLCRQVQTPPGCFAAIMALQVWADLADV